MGRDPYDVLGVPPGASAEEVRAAWRSVSKLVHPDLGGSAAEFREALAAYEALSDPDRRAAIDGRRRPFGGFCGFGGDEREDESASYDWPIEPLLVPTGDDRFAWTLGRSARSAIAIAMALAVIVVMLLMPAVLAAQT